MFKFSSLVDLKFNFLIPFVFILFLLLNSCSEDDPTQYPELIKGHWYTKVIGNRIDLIFVDNKKVVIIIEAVGLTLERKYKFIENNQFLMIEGFKNYHKIQLLNEEEMRLVEDPQRLAKRKSPLTQNLFLKIKE